MWFLTEEMRVLTHQVHPVVEGLNLCIFDKGGQQLGPDS